MNASRHLITDFSKQPESAGVDPISAVCERIHAIVETLGHVLMPDDVASAFGLPSEDALSIKFHIQFLPPTPPDAPDAPAAPFVELPLVERHNEIRKGLLKSMQDAVGRSNATTSWSKGDGVSDEQLMRVVTEDLGKAFNDLRAIAQRLERFRISCTLATSQSTDAVRKMVASIGDDILTKVLLPVRNAMCTNLNAIGGIQNEPRALVHTLKTLWDDRNKPYVSMSPRALSELLKHAKSGSGFAVLPLAHLLDNAKFETREKGEKGEKGEKVLSPTPSMPIAGAVCVWSRQMALSNRQGRLPYNSSLNVNAGALSPEQQETLRQIVASNRKEATLLQEQLSMSLQKTYQKLVESSEATREDGHMQVTLMALRSLVVP